MNPRNTLLGVVAFAPVVAFLAVLLLVFQHVSTGPSAQTSNNLLTAIIFFITLDAIALAVFLTLLWRSQGSRDAKFKWAYVFLIFPPFAIPAYWWRHARFQNVAAIL